MGMFFDLMLKVLPLYVTIAVGFVAGRSIRALDHVTIGKLLFYVISPIVVFFGLLRTRISPELVSLPMVTFVICSVMSLVVYKFSALVFRDQARNMLAFSSGSSGMGFFGLPVAIALFDDATISIYLLCYVGMLFYENSFGFYIVTQGIYTTRQCAQKLIRLPAFYATIASFAFNYFHVPIPAFLLGVASNMAGTYMVLGTMLLGIAVANVKDFSIDFKLITFTMVIKYAIWPMLILSLIYLDRISLQLYDTQVYKAFILLAIVPISNTIVVLSSMLNSNPDKAAMMLLISTLIGLFYVPLVISILRLNS